jgi:two-component sensor histidine kinase
MPVAAPAAGRGRFLSSSLTDYLTSARSPARRAQRAGAARLDLPRLGLRPASGHQGDAGLDLGFRFAVVQFGYWLGWASILVVLAGLTLDVGARHRWVLLGVTLAAAAGNTVAMVIPWREWLATRRGRALLDLWCGGLIAFVALLVINAGSNFALLLFLAVPFIAVVQSGWRRRIWLAVSACTCAVAAALIPLSVGATAMRLGLVAAAVAAALLLTRTIRRETAAHRRAAANVELERTLASEAHHRIKNDLQATADLLLLGRPQGADGAAFDDTAARIRSIATVHRLLTESTDRIDGEALLQGIAASAAAPVAIEADPSAFDAATAQKLGIVANELLTNAVRHGAPPIVVRLSTGDSTRLCVDDSGDGGEHASGFGLALVRRMVEDGLNGHFELSARAGGGTRAEVVFPAVSE